MPKLFDFGKYGFWWRVGYRIKSRCGKVGRRVAPRCRLRLWLHRQYYMPRIELVMLEMAIALRRRIDFSCQDEILRLMENMNALQRKVWIPSSHSCLFWSLFAAGIDHTNPFHIELNEEEKAGLHFWATRLIPSSQFCIGSSEEVA